MKVLVEEQNKSKQYSKNLKKIARVFNDQKQHDILIEGHTDDVPVSTPLLVDNRDLSVIRATSVVRQPTDAQRSLYFPKFDEFFELLEPTTSK